MQEIEKYKVLPNGDIVNTKTGRVLKPQDNGKGYKKVTLTINRKQIQRYVHRLVAESYCSKPKVKIALQVNHKDGDKSNNHYTNLEWVTNSENQKHAHRIGLKGNGSQLYNAKFNSNDIKKMIEMDKDGVKRTEIALFFNCAKSTISDILNGKRYQNLYFSLTRKELELNASKL